MRPRSWLLQPQTVLLDPPVPITASSAHFRAAPGDVSASSGHPLHSMPERTRHAKAEKQDRYRSQLERDYALLLDAKKRLGEIIDWDYESITLHLGHDCRYTVDFFVMANDCVVELHETKGPRQWDDAMVKLRVAARKYPFRFKLCKKPKGEDWTIVPVSP